VSDLISRQAALEAIQARADMELADINHNYLMGFQEAAEAVESVPDAQPVLDEWCTDCKEYDKEKHCCPRFNRVIREALKDAQPEERTNERTETHACDLIDRREAIDALHMHLMYRMSTESNKQRLDAWINNLPSAQPEIIRCKDCRNNHWCNIQEAAMAGDNFFCGAAERRTDEQ